MCGFLIPASAIPGWWIWCYWTNPIAYTLYGARTEDGSACLARASRRPALGALPRPAGAARAHPLRRSHPTPLLTSPPLYLRPAQA